jgi:hypothetical protein
MRPKQPQRRNALAGEYRTPHCPASVVTKDKQVQLSWHRTRVHNMLPQSDCSDWTCKHGDNTWRIAALEPLRSETIGYV